MGRVAVVSGNNKDRVVSSSFNIERKCYFEVFGLFIVLKCKVDLTFWTL